MHYEANQALRTTHWTYADVLAHLERWGAARDWIGPDPYEGLNSPLGRLARTRRGSTGGHTAL